MGLKFVDIIAHLMKIALDNTALDRTKQIF